MGKLEQGQDETHKVREESKTQSKEKVIGFILRSEMGDVPERLGQSG